MQSAFVLLVKLDSTTVQQASAQKSDSFLEQAVHISLRTPPQSLETS